jgi:hypothetical protein
MHATTEQLLSLRDGLPVPVDAARHVADCPACQAERERLAGMRARLKALPAVAPPRDLWQTVAIAVLRDRPPPRRDPWAALAGFAASFVLGLALILQADRQDDAGLKPASVTPSDRVAATPARQPAREWMERSRRLEAALRAMPAARRVTRAGTALTLSELEEQLRRVDMRLGQSLPPEAHEALWRQRVRLMDSLVLVRYAQATDER